MKDVLVSAIMIAVGIIGLANIDNIQRIYASVYPSSAIERVALARCAAVDRAFDRLDPGERANCYARIRPTTGAEAAPMVSLQGMPQDDIRRLQATSR